MLNFEQNMASCDLKYRLQIITKWRILYRNRGARLETNKTRLDYEFNVEENKIQPLCIRNPLFLAAEPVVWDKVDEMVDEIDRIFAQDIFEIKFQEHRIC